MLIDKTKIYKIKKFENKVLDTNIIEIHKRKIKFFNFVLREDYVRYRLKNYCKVFDTKEELLKYYYDSNRYFIKGDKVISKPLLEITFINQDYVSFHFNTMKELNIKYNELLNKLNNSEYNFISID